MTSIYPLGAVKPWTRRPGLAQFKKQGHRESFRVPEGFGNARINCRGSIGMRYATGRRCWVSAKHVTISPSCSRIVSHLKVCDLAGLASRPLGMKRRNS